jgi:Xaa-Pro aminopeptidase
MKEIRRDGRPHTAVGLDFRVACRTGVATAYPHPNQFHHEHVRKGDALQIATLIRIGGYGGELYRAYQLAPWDSRRERVWDVHTEACRVQEQASLAGVTGSHVAWLVHQHQVKSGFAGLVYHRPAHGAGMEGHQAPYISLGDHTMLEEGMMFSNEPGLYDPRGGFGYNHSDTILVAKERGIRMSSVPLTREWCFLAL